MVLRSALICLMSIGVAYGYIICDYIGNFKSSFLKDASCDVVAFSDSMASSSGRFEKVSSSHHTDGLNALREYRCGRIVYFEHRLCGSSEYIDLTVSREGQLGSIEDAMRYAHGSFYDGFVVILCDLNTPEYQALENELLLKVKALASSFGFPYGIRMSGNRENFPVNDHKDTAEFIAISHKVLTNGPTYLKTDYDMSLDVSNLLGPWIGKGIAPSKLLFYLRPMLIETDTPPNVVLATTRNICSTLADKGPIKDQIANMAKDIAAKIKSIGVKGVFLDGLYFDDYSAICENGTFPFIKTIKTALLPIP